MGSTDTPATFWREDCVICPLTAGSPGEAVRQLAARLTGRPGMRDPGEFQRAVEFREKENSTYLGSGIALPHARADAVECVIVAAGAAPAGIPWPTAADSVRMVFLVGVPRKMVREYLELVRRISKAARPAQWLQRATQSADPAALAALLRATIG
jgi:mannitol/fructose-specific phosphotransferase system IIA component (Ntr-type)